MPCDPVELKSVPLFSLLDADELAVLAAQVELRTFAARQRIYQAGDPGARAYLVVRGAVHVTMVDEEGQEVRFSEPRPGEAFGFASMLDATTHATTAIAQEETVCVEVDRNDLSELLKRKPLAGLDMLTVLAREIHSAQRLVRDRSARSANQLIEEQETFGDRIADRVASFGGSWRFIISFLVILIVYTAVNVVLGTRAWDPYPFILLNLFLSMLAAVQAPVIMMSQNRQDAKDRTRSELDFDVNQRAEREIQGLSRQLNALSAKVHDVEAELRRKAAS